MKYSDVIPKNTAITDLKRIATIIKNDISRTSDLTEIKKILQEARPQFIDSQRINKQLNQVLERGSNEIRLLSHIIIFEKTDPFSLGNFSRPGRFNRRILGKF